MYRLRTGSRWCAVCAGRFSLSHFGSVAHIICGVQVSRGERLRTAEPPPRRLNGAVGARVLAPEHFRAGAGDGRAE